jgi:hypothetical protein
MNKIRSEKNEKEYTELFNFIEPGVSRVCTCSYTHCRPSHTGAEHGANPGTYNGTC